jgi:hypothetical protein
VAAAQLIGDAGYPHSHASPNQRFKGGSNRDHAAPNGA